MGVGGGEWLFEQRQREGLDSRVVENVSASVSVEYWLKMGGEKAETSWRVGGSSQLREGPRVPPSSLWLKLSEWNHIRCFPALWGS